MAPMAPVEASFRREMGCTEADWLRWLPQALAPHEWQHSATSAQVHIPPGQLLLDWQVAQPWRIALLRMPRLVVSFRFVDVCAQRRQTFMQRFDLYLQRGGG